MIFQFILEIYVYRPKWLEQNELLNSPLRNFHQYIFPTLCNTLHSKDSKHTICDIDYKRCVSLCMRVSKEIVRKKTMR